MFFFFKLCSLISCLGNCILPFFLVSAIGDSPCSLGIIWKWKENTATLLGGVKPLGICQRGQDVSHSSRKGWTHWKFVLSYLSQGIQRNSSGCWLQFLHRSMFLHRAGEKPQHRHSSRSNPVSSSTKESKPFVVLLMSFGGSLLQLLQPRES